MRGCVKRRGRVWPSVFVPFSEDVPDDGARQHLPQINLLAQSGQERERIKEGFHPPEFKILIHLVERFLDFRRLHEPPK
jgi:hypothetical protein